MYNRYVCHISKMISESWLLNKTSILSDLAITLPRPTFVTPPPLTASDWKISAKVNGFSFSHNNSLHGCVDLFVRTSQGHACVDWCQY